MNLVGRRKPGRAPSLRPCRGLPAGPTSDPCPLPLPRCCLRLGAPIRPPASPHINLCWLTADPSEMEFAFSPLGSFLLAKQNDHSARSPRPPHARRRTALESETSLPGQAEEEARSPAQHTQGTSVCSLPSPSPSPQLSMSSVGPLCAGHGDRAVSCCRWRGGAGVVPIRGPRPMWSRATTVMRLD